MNAPLQSQPDLHPGVSRRTFIKGVIAAGAAVSASSYLFRGPERWCPCQQDANGRDKRHHVP